MTTRRRTIRGRSEQVAARVHPRARKRAISAAVQPVRTGSARRSDLEYLSPKRRARALRETGTVRMPRREAVRVKAETVRGIKNRRSAKAVNPFTGRRVGVRGGAGSRRVRSKASARRFNPAVHPRDRRGRFRRK